MTTEELQIELDKMREVGYTVVHGNDGIGDGWVLFLTMAHSHTPSPIMFQFWRLRNDGELSKCSFAMPIGSWKTILVEAIKDIL